MKKFNSVVALAVALSSAIAFAGSDVARLESLMECTVVKQGIPESKIFFEANGQSTSITGHLGEISGKGSTGIGYVVQKTDRENVLNVSIIRWTFDCESYRGCFKHDAIAEKKVAVTGSFLVMLGDTDSLALVCKNAY